ncbi:MAG: glycosyltransferase [Pirellulaceae bacterium]|nr:glycosyltransferase [Pirellulaceae bacterium]
MDNKLLSIIINYFNPNEHPRIEATLLLALESISSYTHHSYEVIISDASTNVSARLHEICLRKHWTYLHMPQASFPEGFNKGASKATGEYLVLMASDIFVCADWDKTLLCELKRTEAWMAAPYLTASDYRAQTQFWGLRMKTFSPSAMTLNLIMISAQHFEQLGMLDPNLGHFNDIDLLFRVRESGGEAIIAYCGQVSHISGATMSVATSIDYRADKDIFLNKHPCLKSRNARMDYDSHHKRFMRNPLLRTYFKVCASIPLPRAASFLASVGTRIEPVLNKA